MTPAGVGSQPSCPKRMTFGPCGGVRPDGECEIGGLACPFLDAGLPEWDAVERRDAATPEASSGAQLLRAALARGGAVVVDFSPRPLDAGSLRDCAAVLTGTDAVLTGDSPRNRVQFPPSFRAGLLQAAGVTVWVGLNARDRNRVALEGELAALAQLRVAGVHCVTGDHPASGSRPDALGVFDLDSTELADLASGRGLLVSVGETPAAPPLALRPTRLLSKERAGAEVCFINPCGGVDPVTAFVGAARRLGSQAAMIACVPVVCDAGSAALLASFASAGPDTGGYAAVLAAADPRQAGITAALELGRRMLDSGVVAGIHLTGGPAEGGELAYADALAEVTEGLRR